MNRKYFLPPDFNKHLATWMIYPYRLDTWHDEAKPARQAYANVANAIVKFEPVLMVTRDEDTESARELLDPSVKIVNIPFDSEWARDTGPLFVKDGDNKTHGIDFKFDSWSGVYTDYELDDKLATEICNYRGYPVIQNDFVLEGGSILVDGEGTLIATEECLLSPKRTIHHTKEEIEKIFHELFGIKKVIWIKRGVYMDTVNGHIDNLCAFVKPQVITLAWTDDKNDPQYEISSEALEILNSTTDAKGRKFEIIKIHQPNPLYQTKEESSVVGESFVQDVNRLCATYINYYFVNGGIIMPSFGDSRYDKLAFETLSSTFKDRKVIQLPTREILLGGGGIHCITMQEPI